MRGMPSTRGARVRVIALAGLLACWGCADFDEAQRAYCQNHLSLCTTSDVETTYLSDACWSSYSNGYGPVEKDLSNGGPTPGDGHTLTLDGRTYPKGLGVHADSEVVFDLGKSCSTFTAEIGVDDETENRGSVVFQVRGDDTLLFESGTMTGDTATQSVNVDLSGRSTLKLIVTNAGDGIASDLADWANARITCDARATSLNHDDSSITSLLSLCTPSDAETTYLSDHTWSSPFHGWGPVEKDRSNGEQASGDGHTLTLNGITYPKGLGVHADSEVDFKLGNPCSTFTADIGVDDEVGSRGSVVFQVRGDDTLLFESGTMTGDTATQSINVNLSGRSTLKLIVMDAGDGIVSDHADWANARITCEPTP